MNLALLSAVAAVAADWERRFGTRVVAVGPATLHLGVAAPPTTTTDTLRVAAEHLAFCPDNIRQNHHPHTLTAYARQLVTDHHWAFWWD
ncbi:DUF4253 domain-containing protein [Kitasatospora sp. NPDC094019]|uniref:DUF4253 domain-containing protein n=1 Tax=Kitasatospora sp. NPDC094019 TaxID=3364091 RepID=UPI003829A18F